MWVLGTVERHENGDKLDEQVATNIRKKVEKEKENRNTAE